MMFRLPSELIQNDKTGGPCVKRYFACHNTKSPA